MHHISIYYMWDPRTSPLRTIHMSKLAYSRQTKS